MFLCADKQSSVCLPMYEELQPGQVDSYTTFDLLSGGVLSFVLVKKHNLWSSV